MDRAIALSIIPAYLQSNYAQNITRAEFCTVLAKTLSLKNRAAYSGFEPATQPFTDTNDRDVLWLNSLEIVSGIGNNLFNPYGQITRQEAAVMLRRAAIAFGVSDIDVASQFADQSEVASWAAEALGFVVAKGIMNGTGNNKFTPRGTYTREQSYTTLVRLYDIFPANN